MYTGHKTVFLLENITECVLENAMMSLDDPQTIVLTGEYEGVDLSPRECRNKRGVAYAFEDTGALNTLKDGLSWW